MKNKAFNLSSRCLAFFLSLVMLMSCFTAVAFASDETESGGGASAAPQPSEGVTVGGEASSSQSGTSFSDGVYTLTIDLDSLFEMIDNGSFSLEGLKGLIPAEILDAATASGGVAEKVRALLTAYIDMTLEGDSSKIFELLPIDMTIKYLTDGSDPYLWHIISKEELMEAIDIVAIFNKLSESGELDSIIDFEAAADVALNGGLIDADTIKNIINDLKSNEPEKYNELINLVADKVLNSTDPDIIEIRDQVIEEVTSKPENVDKIAALIGTEALKELVTDEDINALLNLIKPEDIEALIKEKKVDINGLLELIGAGGIEDLVKNGAIDIAALLGLISDDDIKKLISGDEPAIDIEELLNIIDPADIKTLIANDHINVKELLALVDTGTLESLINNETITVDMLLDNISEEDIKELISNGYIDAEGLIKLFDNDTLIELVSGDDPAIDIKQIIKLIDVNDIKTLIGDGSINVKTLLTKIKPETLEQLIKEDKIKVDAIVEALREEDIKALIKNGSIDIKKLLSHISDTTLDDLVNEKGAINVSALLNAISDEDIKDLISNKYINIQGLLDLIDIGTLVENGSIQTDKLAEVIDAGTLTELINKDNNVLYSFYYNELNEETRNALVGKINTGSIETYLNYLEPAQVEMLFDKLSVNFTTPPTFTSTEPTKAELIEYLKENIDEIDPALLFDVLLAVDGSVFANLNKSEVLTYRVIVETVGISTIINSNIVDTQAVINKVDPAELIAKDVFVISAVMDALLASVPASDLFDNININAVMEKVDTNTLVDDGIITNIDALKNVIKDLDVATLLDNDVIEVNGILSVIEPQTLIEKDVIVVEDVMDALLNGVSASELFSTIIINDIVGYIPANKFISDGIIKDLDAILTEVKEFSASELLSNNIFNVEEVINKVDIGGLIATEGFDINAVMNAVMGDSAITPEVILENITIDEVIKVLSNIEPAKFVDSNNKVITDIMAVVNVVSGIAPETLISANVFKDMDAIMGEVRDIPVADIINNNIFDIPALISQIGGAKVLIDNGIVTVDEIIDTVGGISKLMNEGIVNEQMFMDKLNNAQLQAIVLEIGTDKLVELCGVDRIINAIGIDRLIADPEINALINYPELINILLTNGYIDMIDRNAVISSIDKGAIIEIASLYLAEFSKSISLNGEKIFDAKTAKFDINRLTQVLAESIPTFDTLAADPENAFSFVIDWELNKSALYDDVENQKDHYKFGFEVKLAGDTERAAKIFEELAGYISVINSGENTDIVINVPAKFASLCLKAVNTDKIPLALKDKILTYINMEITDDNVESMISDFTLEEIATIIENADFNRVLDVIDRMNGIYAGAYDRALTIAKRAVNAMTYEKLLTVAEKLKINAVGDKLDGKEDKIDELRSRILDFINKMTEEELNAALKDGTLGDYGELVANDVRASADIFNAVKGYLIKVVNKAFDYAPSKIVGTQLSDLYAGSGKFGPFSASFSFDIATKLEQLPIPNMDVVMDFLAGTEIKRNVSFQITLRNIFEAEFVDLEGKTVFVTYLPAGADISVITQIDALKGNAWTCDGETEAQKMPAADTAFHVFTPEHVHEWEEIERVEPTCTEKGYYIERCNGCHIEQTIEIAELGHDWYKKETVDPTCTEKGYELWACSRCDATEKRNEQETVEHIFDEYVETVEPSCTTEGYELWRCSLCHTAEEKRDVKDKLDHVWEFKETVPPTCMEKGYDLYTCKNCDATEERNPTDKIPHNYEKEDGHWNWVVIEYPTQTAKGEARVVCTYECGTKITTWPLEMLPEGLVDPKGNYDPINEILNGNCHERKIQYSTSVGNGDYKDTLVFTVKSPLTHEFTDEPQTIVNPTVTKTGSKTWECQKEGCSGTKTETIATLPAKETIVRSNNSGLYIKGMFATKDADGNSIDHNLGGYLLIDENGNYHSSINKEDWDEKTEKGFSMLDVMHAENVVINTADGLYDPKYGFTVYVPVDEKYKDRINDFVAYHQLSDGSIEMFAVDPNKLGIEPDENGELDTSHVINVATVENAGGQEITVLEFTLYSFSPVVLGVPHIHEYGDWIKDTDPTFDSAGQYRRVCTEVDDYNRTCDKDGYIEYVTLNSLKNGDDEENGYIYKYRFVADSTDATAGTSYYKVAPGIIDGNGIPEFSVVHTWVDWEVGSLGDPTADAEGYLERYCVLGTDCDCPNEYPTHYQTCELLPLKPENVGTGDGQYEEIVHPNCNATNLVDTYIFKIDGQEFKFTTAASEDDYVHGEHKWEVKTGYVPTATGGGTLELKCPNCGDVSKTQTLKPLNKGNVGTGDGEYASVEHPKCNAAELVDTYTFEIDGQEFKFTTEADPSDYVHDWSEWTADEDDMPSYDKVGSIKKTCSYDVDGEHTVKVEDVLPMLDDIGYTVVADEGRKPTCENTGYGTFTIELSEYGEISFKADIKAIGHKWSDWTITPPDDTNPGSAERTCQNDSSHSDVRQLPALNVEGKYSYDETTPPTCHTTGKGTYTFLDEPSITFTKDIPIDETLHDWSDWTVTPPTADQAGSATRKCENKEHTEDVYDDPITFPALKAENVGDGKAYSYAVTKDPTCSAEGIGTYTYKADTTFSFDVDIDIVDANHKWGAWEVGTLPTYDAAGTIKRVCEHNGEHVEEESVLPKLGDVGDGGYELVPTTDPSCENAGEGTYKITLDGYGTITFTAEIKATGHNWSDWTVTVKPTDTTTGTATRTCSNAEHEPNPDTDTFTLPPLTDSGYEKYDYQDSTCTVKGFDKYKFTHPDGSTIDLKIDRELDPDNHVWSDWSFSKLPTETESGTLVKTCACGDTMSYYDVPALKDAETDSNYIVTRDEPTCTDPGTVEYEYRAPDGVVIDVTTVNLDKLPHTYDTSWKYAEGKVAPTQTEGSIIEKACTVCGQKYTESLEPLSATDAYDYSVKEDSTCGKAGTGIYTHKKTGFKIEVTIPEKEHVWGAWEVTTAPTKDTDGVLTKVCENDEAHTETVTIPKLDANSYEMLHKYESKSATCTDDGYEKFIFTYDGKDYLVYDEKIEALGHDFGAWDYGKAPTLTESGTIVRACKNGCGHEETEEVPALNSFDKDNIEVISVADCENSGKTKYKYSFGGVDFYYEIDTPALGHEFEEWKLDIAPTMTTGGKTVRSCKNDPSHIEAITIPSISEGGDAYTLKETVEPTATEDGYAIYTYAHSGQTFEVKVTLPATGASTPTEPDDGFWWWWILLIILLVIAAAVVIFFIIKHNNDKKPPKDTPKPVAPVAPAPKKKPEPKPKKEQPKAAPAPIPTKERTGKKTIVNISDINEAFSEGEVVSLEALKEKNLISKSAKRYKVLSNGTLDKALTVEADEFSPSAIEKINAAGGKIVKVRVHDHGDHNAKK